MTPVPRPAERCPVPDPKPSRPEAIRQMVRFALNMRRKDRETR